MRLITDETWPEINISLRIYNTKDHGRVLSSFALKRALGCFSDNCRRYEIPTPNDVTNKHLHWVIPFANLKPCLEDLLRQTNYFENIPEMLQQLDNAPPNVKRNTSKKRDRVEDAIRHL